MTSREISSIGWRLRLRDALRSRWPLLVIGAASLILFAPFVLGMRMFYWGTPLLQFAPWREFGFSEMLAGRLPLWNPLVGAGAPLLANYQSALLYPPNWLGLIAPLDLAHNWLLVGHVALAGLGMAVLTRHLGYARLGQAVAGLSFGLSQYVVARASFYSINAVVVWTPWLVWAADRLLLSEGRAPRLRAVLWVTGLATLQLLGGHAQTTWYTWLLLAVWALWRLRSAPAGQHMSRLGNALILVVGGAWAALIAAAQLIPTAELLRSSQRADSAELGFVMTYSFSPWRLLTLLAPDLFGTPAGREFFGYGMYLEDAVYSGVAPLLLAIGAALSWLWRAIRSHLAPGNAQARSGGPRPAVPLGLAVFLIVVGLILGLGANTPIFPWLYANVPTFNMFQAPTRMMLWLVFGLALLAGWGATRWRAVGGRALYWVRLGTAGSVGMALVALWLAQTLPLDERPMQLMRWMALGAVPAGLNLAMVGALTLLAPGRDGDATQPVAWRRVRDWAWPTLLVAAIAIDLILANVGVNPGAAADLYDRPGAADDPIRAAVGEGRLFTFPDDEHTLKFEPYFDFASYGDPPLMAQGARDVLLPNTGMLAGIATFNNFDPLISGRSLAFTQALSETRSLALLRLADVRVVLAPTQSGPAGLDWSNWPVVAEVAGAQARTVPGISAHTRVVYSSVQVADAAESLAAIRVPGFDPELSVVLEPAIPAPRGAFDPGDLEAATVTLDRAGWVVFSDALYPGWIAFVDGQPVDVYPADLAFRAVAAPAGTHTIAWAYRPATWAWGSALSLVGLVPWLIGLAVAYRTTRRSNPR